ncbi:hypothetical protein AeRB84_008722 [Aphanomyces euteiches]|nr:hypothetical protein AeRB84_008722 [Aphanomyces euteiches]
MIEPAKLDSYGPKALPQQAFARRLFAHYTSRLQKESFVFALAAVLLVYYTDTMTKYPQHKVLDAMAAACTTVCGHNSPSDAEKTLREWGDGVRERFVRENVARLPSSNEEETLRNNFASTLSRVVQAQSDTASNVAAIRCEVQHQGDLQREIVKLQQQLFEQQMSMMEQQKRQSISLAALQTSITALVGGSRASNIPSVVCDVSSVASRPKHSPLLTPPRKWPPDLNALRGWMMSSLLYRCWCERLESIPLDPACRAQRDVRSIAAIARNLLGSNVPPDPGDIPSLDWQENAKAAAVEAQRLALARVNATTIVRKRKKTGSALGVLRAWRR